MILVTSGWILFAMPKSINFSEAFTMTKFAGFKSLWTIPTQKRYLQLLDIPDHFPHLMTFKLGRFTTMFVDGLDGL